MKEVNSNKLKQWAEKLGVSVETLMKQYEETRALFKQNVPAKTEEWYEETAIHRMYLQIKGDLRSPAIPFDVAWLGYSLVVDVTAQEMEEKRNLWLNPETRAQAIAEGKVYAYTSEAQGPRMTMTVDGQDKPVPDGTPLDTREWMIPPNREKGVAGMKNRNYRKPLQSSLIRNYIGLGRPAVGGMIKLVSLMAAGADRVKILPAIPPEFSPSRSRLNVRADEPARYVCNMSTKTRFEKVQMTEIPDVKTLMDFLETAPPELKIDMPKLPDWHREHEGDPRRMVILEGDVSYINREPTMYGSLMIVLEDTSKEDMEAEGIPVWVPKVLDEAGQLNFGPYSRVYVIGRTNIGPGFNRETRQPDPTVERVMINAIAVIAIPEFRVPPEEESVVESTQVK